LIGTTVDRSLPNTMSSFVILHHDSPRGVHFDFMLEIGDALKTWSLPETPVSGVEMTVEALPDHRLAYLDYEGPVSDGRGEVARWDRGSFAIVRQSEAELVVELTGEKLQGQVVLCCAADDPQRWKFVFTAEGKRGRG